MRIIARIGILSIALFTSGQGLARPVIIEESARLEPPPGIAYQWTGTQVGISGDYALTVAARPREPDIQSFDALLYRRVNGVWAYQRILSQGFYREVDDPKHPVIIGMKDNLASTELSNSGTTIFRFNGTDWVPSTEAPSGPHADVAIDGARILYGVDGWDGRVFEPGGNGGWTSTFLRGQYRCCDDEFWGGPVDLLGNRAILGTPYVFDLEPQEIPIYERSTSGWQIATKLQVPEGVWRLGAEVGLHANNAIVNGQLSGPFVWTNGDFNNQPATRLQTVNAYAQKAITYKFAKEGTLLLASAYDTGFATIVINVFRWDGSARYRHVAILKPRTGTLNGNIQIDGSTVIAGSDPRPYIFELPAGFSSPQSRFENFEGGSVNWTPGPGSQFSVVRPSATNAVYRQASLAGDAYAVLGYSRFVHQGVEADIKPTAFDCADCWFGLATRFLDARNYYYVALRQSGTVQLKRMRNGVFTTLVSAPLTVRPNYTYRVRLDSIGSWHRVYVDGRLLLSYEDNVPVAAGSAAILMYKTRADYDNVAVSPTPRETIFADSFNTPDSYQGDWTYDSQGQWAHANGALVQSSVAGEARAVIGTPTNDQSVAFRVRPTAFAATSNGQERWVGLIARYLDDRNYYYLTLRSGNFLSLRKLVNGVITPIRDVPVSVVLGTRYALRLDVTGTSLRAYLNGNLLIQETDSTHATGRTGAMTWKAAAEFDDYVAYQP